MNMDTIVDFRTAVEAFKSDLRVCVSKRLGEFTAQTGISPTAIRFDMMETTTHGDRSKHYTLGDVRLSFGDY
jgi:hypothetical protein